MTARTRKTGARLAIEPQPVIDAHRGQHLELGRREITTTHGRVGVTVDQAESPLVWLARRHGRDGRALVEPHQLQAGERLRAEFTRAQMMPCTTSNWTNPVAPSRRGGDFKNAGSFTDAVIAARQRVHHALDAAGPEFSGLLLDVCCFLKGLKDVERERAWPSRSAKVVLQLALDRLARHYGFAAQTSGRDHSPIRIWLAPDAAFSVDGV